MQTADLSVLLYVPGTYASVRATMDHLRAQSIVGRLEVLLVTPVADSIVLDEQDSRDFQRIRVIEAPGMKSRGQAMTIAIREANAPLVAFAEDHAFPFPDWAEQLVGAHRSDWGGVSPALLNGNPDGSVSWATFIFAYGRWIPPIEPGVIDELPVSNACYKRALLLESGPQLAMMLEREGKINAYLRWKGHELFIEPAAKVRHFNISRFVPSVLFRFHTGRAFGASRAALEHWSPLRRLLYVAGSPIIPLMYARPIMQRVRRCNREQNLLPRIVPALVSALVAHAAGEAVGYALGIGDCRRRILNYENNLEHNMTQRDRNLKAECSVAMNRASSRAI